MTAEQLYPLALAVVNDVADQRCGVTIPKDAREWMARLIAEQMAKKGRATD